MKKLSVVIATIVASFSLLTALAANASAASLTLSPSSKTINVGDTLTVSIILDTGGASIDGVDIQALNYNPYYLQLQDSDSATAGTQIAPGSLMVNTLANSADTTNGKIVFSQVTSGGTTYKGSGTLATLTFKALVAGTATLGFNFTSGATTDTNVASAGSDILSSVTNGSFIINNTAGSQPGTPSPAPTPSPSGSPSALSLINNNGTYYLVLSGIRHGITNPGMLASYGFSFALGRTATANDMTLPEGSLLTPGDGALVKSKEDPTVYLISGQKRYGFVSSAVYFGLGFKFSSVLVVTNPELQSLPLASNLDNGAAAHLPGVDINRSGTIYWVGGDSMLHAFPSLAIYNSWRVSNNFATVVPANAADLTYPVGSAVGARVIN